MNKILLITILIMVIVSPAAIAQTPAVRSFFTEKPGQPRGHYYFADEDEKKKSTPANRYIIKLSNPQNHHNTVLGTSSLTRAIQDQHTEFKSALKRIAGTSQTTTTDNPGAVILFEYSRVYNGFAMELNETLRKEVANLPYVESIIEDKQVKAIDLQSSQVINADDVWNDFGVTGNNIRIGIIDTGIDYTHPDLGGGLGAGFKVKGGYDFVNNDADPMDDHNHGTHVAGIAAANGPGLKGVAPDADLYGFKVLDKFGYGLTSWIIAGIERSVDPDQNPATDDKMHVVNMSLGGPVSSPDPMSEAVNNAVSQGVIFVIAAGNSYDYGTIGSPGIAQKAITVGATDFSDYTAYFSSKGPTPDFQIKPDVAAPGVEIYSSIPGSQYAKYSGTSMASPHVAGAAALLLEQHPDWTVETVKSALMGTAVNPHNEMIWHLGAGRIDVLEAIQSEFVIEPGSLSLGLADNSNPIWNQNKTITIRNVSDELKNFTLTAEGDEVGDEAEITITPSVFSLAANASIEVDVSFEVSISALPFKTAPEAYTGNIIASADGKIVKAPYAFIHSKQTKLSLTGELPYWIFVIGTNGSYYYKVYNPLPEMSIFLPDGTVDIICNYTDNHYVIKEDITNTIESTIVFDKTQADNLIDFQFSDANGDPLEVTYNTIGTAAITGNGKNWMTIYFGLVKTFYVSDNTTYRFDVKYFDKQGIDESKYYDITSTTGYGASDDIVVENDQDNFTEIIFKNPDLATGAEQDLTVYLRMGGWTMWHEPGLRIHNPLHVLTTKNPDDIGIDGAYAKFDPVSDGPLTWETGVWNAREDNSIDFSDFWLVPQLKVEDTEEYLYTFGETVAWMNARPNNVEDKVVLVDFPFKGVINGHIGDRQHGSIEYDLINDDDIVTSGSITNRESGDYTLYNLELDVDPDLYTLKLHYPSHKVQDITGSVDVEMTFDTREPDKNPPTMDYFFLESEGKSTEKIATGDPAFVKVKVKDYCTYLVNLDCNDNNIYVDETIIYYKPLEDTEWLILPLTEVGVSEYSAALPEELAEGYYSLRVFVKDLSGNILDYEVNPGFVVGAPIVLPGVTLISPSSGATTTRNPSFSWTNLSDISSYTMQLSTTEGFSDSETFTLTDADFSSDDLLEKTTIYYWRVKANYQGESSPWSQSFHFTTDNDDWKPTLILPADATTNSPHTVSFSWSQVHSSKYTLQVDDNEAFTSPTIASNISGTSKQLTLSANTKYYWRVMAIMSNKWSDVFDITTSSEDWKKALLLSPANNAIDLPFKVSLKWSDVGATSYQVQISESSTFNELIHDSQIENTTESVKLVPGKAYFWRVKPTIDNSYWSDVFKLTTTIPDIDLLEPANDGSAIKIPTKFSWTNIEEMDSYTLKVSTDKNFSTIVYSGVLNASSKEITDLATATTYYWKIGATINNVTIWSDISMFNTLQKQLALVSPANQAVNQKLKLEFIWRNINAEVYLLQVAKDSVFTKLHTALNLTDTTEIISTLNPGKKYFWRVKGVGLSDWSSVYSFNTLTPQILLSSPANNETDLPLDSRLKWEPVDDVIDYTVKISAREDFQEILLQNEVEETLLDLDELSPSTDYYWKVGANFNDVTVWSDKFMFTTQLVTGTETVNKFDFTAHPNPSSHTVEFKFYIASPQRTTIDIATTLGSKVYGYDMGVISGEKTMRWEGIDSQNNVLPDGMYIVTLRTAAESVPLKIVLAK